MPGRNLITAIGGSLESITLAGRTFPTIADADATRQIGGYSNEVSMNGDGATGRLIKTIIPSAIGNVGIEIDDSRGDQEYLQELANRPDFFPGAVTYPSGVTYQGLLQIVGEITANNQTASAVIGLSGPTPLTSQG